MAGKTKGFTASQFIFLSFCKSEGVPEPIPEYRFHASRMWRIDYYFEANGRRLGLEVEGGIREGAERGRHLRAKGFEADMEKYNAMACAGIFLLRRKPAQLNSLETIRLIKAVLLL